MAFVALGMEHSIANMSLIPLGIFAGADVSAAELVQNVGIATVGNILGASLGVAVPYWLVYGTTPAWPGTAARGQY